MPENNQYWIYILLCENNSYYTGYTNNLLKRYESHVAGTGKCKYTKSFKPLDILQCWKTNDKSLAMRLEAKIKKLNKKEKENLVKEPTLLSNDNNVEIDYDYLTTIKKR